MWGGYEQIKVYRAPSSGRWRTHRTNQDAAAQPTAGVESRRGRWTNSGGSNRTCGRLECVWESRGRERDLCGVSDQEVAKMNSFGILNTYLGSFVLLRYLHYGICSFMLHLYSGMSTN